MLGLVASENEAITNKKKNEQDYVKIIHCSTKLNMRKGMIVEVIRHTKDYVVTRSWNRIMATENIYKPITF